MPQMWMLQPEYEDHENEYTRIYWTTLMQKVYN